MLKVTGAQPRIFGGRADFLEWKHFDKDLMLDIRVTGAQPRIFGGRADFLEWKHFDKDLMLDMHFK